jgi:hypothetical protein
LLHRWIAQANLANADLRLNSLAHHL